MNNVSGLEILIYAAFASSEVGRLFEGVWASFVGLPHGFQHGLVCLAATRGGSRDSDPVEVFSLS